MTAIDEHGRHDRRDIDRLRDLGYPVQATMGAEGGYRLVAGTAMPPLLLDDEEAVAIAVGLRTAASQAIQGISEASVRALAKLEQVLPSRLRRRVSTLNTATAAALPDSGARIDPESLAVLAAAVTDRQRLRFEYRAADGTESKRLVEPHRLVPFSRRWYLVAHDTERADWRVFRVDRITGPQPTSVRVEPRELPAEDAAAYVRNKFYSLAPTYLAVATLHAPVEQVAGAFGAGDELEPVDEHRCLLRSHADTLEWLAFRLTTLGCEFEVQEPPELIEYLRVLGARITRAAAAHRNDCPE